MRLPQAEKALWELDGWLDDTHAGGPVRWRTLSVASAVFPAGAGRRPDGAGRSAPTPGAAGQRLPRTRSNDRLRQPVEPLPRTAGAGWLRVRGPGPTRTAGRLGRCPRHALSAR